MAYLTYDDFEIEDGYIYVIKVMGYCKIGKTKNIEKRFGEYTMLFEEPKVILLDYVSDYHRLELDLHNIYEHKRVRGEWFKLSEMDIENIEFVLDSRHVKTDKDRIDELLCRLQDKYHGLVNVELDEFGDFIGCYEYEGRNLKTKIPIKLECTNGYKSIYNSVLKVLSKREEDLLLGINRIELEQLVKDENQKEQELQEQAQLTA